MDWHGALHPGGIVRFAFVGPLSPSTGGIAQYSDRLVGALLGAGHQVDAMTWRSQYPSFMYKGVAASSDESAAFGATDDLRWWDPASWWRAGRRSRGCDALLYSWVTPFQGPSYVAMMAASGTTPAIAIIHNALPHEPSRADERLARWTLGRTAGALAHSTDAATEVARLAPSIEIVQVGVPAILDVTPRPLPDATGGIRVLFMGNIRPYKGLDTALDAMVLLAGEQRPVRLTVAGHVWGSEAEIRDEIGRRDLSAVVDFRPGYVPDAGIDDLLGEHHLVILPYKDSNQSGIVPLAQAAARGIVATDVGSLAETLRDGVDAVVVPPDDPASLADGIRRAAPRVEAMSKASGRATVPWGDIVAALAMLVERAR